MKAKAELLLEEVVSCCADVVSCCADVASCCADVVGCCAEVVGCCAEAKSNSSEEFTGGGTEARERVEDWPVDWREMGRGTISPTLEAAVLVSGANALGGTVRGAITFEATVRGLVATVRTSRECMGVSTEPKGSIAGEVGEGLCWWWWWCTDAPILPSDCTLCMRPRDDLDAGSQQEDTRRERERERQTETERERGRERGRGEEKHKTRMP